VKRRRIESYVTPDEYRQIVASARKAGLSVSKFIRRVCLAQETRSIVDHEAVLVLAKTNADMGRLGGLFKMALSEGKGRSDELRATLRGIEATKNELERNFNAVVDCFVNRSSRK
jgi:uncharacterized protein (DUF1778 family)